MADKPFALIGVNSDRDLDEIREIVKEKNISWRSFWNGPKGTSGPISTEWGVQGWPTIYVLDAKGVVRYKNVRGAEMDEAITTLMKEMGEDIEITHDEEEPEEKKKKKKSEKDSDDDSKDDDSSKAKKLKK